MSERGGDAINQKLLWPVFPLTAACVCVCGGGPVRTQCVCRSQRHPDAPVHGSFALSAPCGFPPVASNLQTLVAVKAALHQQITLIYSDRRPGSLCHMLIRHHPLFPLSQFDPGGLFQRRQTVEPESF